MLFCRVAEEGVDAVEIQLRGGYTNRTWRPAKGSKIVQAARGLPTTLYLAVYQDDYNGIRYCLRSSTMTFSRSTQC